MAGGEPEGINTLPELSGCRNNKTSRTTMPMQGKTRISAKGTEMVFRRMRLRSRLLSETPLADCDTSPKDWGNDCGCMCFVSRSTKPIGAVSVVAGGESGMVSGMWIAEAFGRETVERRRGLSRPLRVSSFVGGSQSRLQ
jgi:hypothetical protein